MRKAITALLLAAAAAGTATAQPGVSGGAGEIRRDRQDGRDQRQDQRGDWRDTAQNRDRGDWRQDRQGDRDVRGDRGDDRRDWRGDDRDGRRDDRQDWRRDGRGNDGRGYAGNDRWNGGNGWNGNDRNRGNWNNGWRNDRRYDWQGYRSTNRRAYSLPRYYAPSGFGYGYRRYGVGLRIGAPFYGQRYLISDPWSYRLPPAYGPYRWTRYYNDVLLVDTYTGVVQDAIHGFFY